MKIFKIIILILVLLLALFLFVIGPVYFIPITVDTVSSNEVLLTGLTEGKDYLGNIIITFLKLDEMVVKMGQNLFSVITSYLSGVLFTVHLFMTFGLIKKEVMLKKLNRIEKPKKDKEKKIKKKKGPKVEEVEVKTSLAVSPRDIISEENKKRNKAHSIKF